MATVSYLNVVTPAPEKLELIDPAIAAIVAAHIELCNSVEHSADEKACLEKRNDRIRALSPRQRQMMAVVGGAISRMAMSENLDL